MTLLLQLLSTKKRYLCSYLARITIFLFMNKGILTAVGFTLFMVGAVSILISLVGLQLAPIVWMDNLGRGIGLFLKVAMVCIGAIIAFFSKIDLSKTNDEYTLEGRG